MIKGTFRLGGDIFHVVVDKGSILFTDSSGVITTVEGLKLSHSGVIKEHPDLIDDDEWRKKALERLKEHIKKFKTEQMKINYVKDELKKHGYVPMYKQQAGFRPQKFDGC